MMFTRWFIPLYLFLYLQTTNGQIWCTENEDIVGVKETKSKKSNNYEKDTVNAVLNFDNEYKFDCCGFINKWQIFVRKDPSTLRVKVQVWYDSGTTWILRGENDITASDDDKENEIPITTEPRIRAFKDDYIGFYEYAGSVITYGNGDDYKTAFFASNQTTFDWTAETLGDNRVHAIHARITQSLIPAFTNLDDTVAITNNEVAGTVIFTLTASDNDPEDAGLLTVAHTGSTGSAATFFELDSTTWEVKIRSDVSLSPGNHAMNFSVTDPCSRSSISTLTVRVENDPPVITSLATSNSITISEDLTTETLLHTLMVTDSTPTTCQLDSTGVPFEIKTKSGSTDYGIFLLAGASMDYDTQNAYVLDLSCNDTFDVTTGVYTVYLVRNEPPTINGLPRATDMQEDVVVETTLYTLSVTDPESTVVTCDVTAITPNTNIMFIKPSSNFNEFDIVLQSNPSLQYDVVRTYRLDIQCSDGRRTDSGVFFFNVLRNKPPVFSNLQNVTTVSSVASYIGQIVFDVEISDPENDQVFYVLSGEIVLTRSIEGEFVPAYDLYVYVTDGKSTTGPRSLTVHVLDINYVPVIKNLPLPSALVVSENSLLGLSIFQISIQDNDGHDIHTYSMTSSPSDGVLYFDIDSATGLISTSATTNINYEAVSSTSFTFTITVSDTKDSASQDLTVIIANQNEAPMFTKTSYALSVDEGSAGTILGDPGYLYKDEDTGDTHTFSMNCASNVGYFSIVPTTGFISLATDIDVDAVGSATSYTCTVKVSDGSLTDSASLTINVNNVNDNTPMFSNNLFTYYLDINYPLNTPFGSTVATDADDGTFGNFIYSIDQTSLGTETFGIQANGDLYLKNSLTSYGYGSSISFIVQATNTGSLHGTATVFIVIPQTTTTTTTTTDRPITFWEYPANPAWVIIAGLIGLIIMVLPCYMCYKNGCTCEWRGRPGDYRERLQEPSEKNQKKDKQPKGYSNGSWKAWKWYEQQ